MNREVTELFASLRDLFGWVVPDRTEIEDDGQQSEIIDADGEEVASKASK